MQMAALSLELADLKRGEAQLAGEVGLLQQELADTAQQLADARRQLQEQQQQADATAISSTYPLLRAARLLGAWTSTAASAEARLAGKGATLVAGGDAAMVGGKRSRPWPCIDGTPLTAPEHKQPQSQRCGLHAAGHALTKHLQDTLSPDQQQAAAAAAAAWTAELARTQQLLAAALQRAERCEMDLAAARLSGAGGPGVPASRLAAHAGGADGAAATLAAQEDMVICSSALGFDRGRGAGAAGSELLPGAVRVSLSSSSSPDELRQQAILLQQDLMSAHAQLRAAR